MRRRISILAFAIPFVLLTFLFSGSAIALHQEVTTRPTSFILGPTISTFGSQTMSWCDPTYCDAIPWLSVGSDVYADLFINLPGVPGYNFIDDSGNGGSFPVVTGSDLLLDNCFGGCGDVRVGDFLFDGSQPYMNVVDGSLASIIDAPLSDVEMDSYFPGWGVPPILADGSLASAIYSSAETTAFLPGSIVEIEVDLTGSGLLGFGVGAGTIGTGGAVISTSTVAATGMVLVFDGVQERTDVYLRANAAANPLSDDVPVYFLAASNTMPVPIPAAGVLYVSALALVGWLRRRTR